MNQLCWLTNLTSSEMAAWTQAVVSSIAIIVGVWVVNWQMHRSRLEQAEHEARVLEGLAYLLIQLKESAHEAREEKKKLERLPPNHPAEPIIRFKELAEIIHRFPLEAILGLVPIKVILIARGVAVELLSVVGPEAEIDVNADHEHWFQERIETLDKQILSLQDEAKNLKNN